MSHYKFEQLMERDVSSKHMFESSSKFNDVTDKTTKFYRRKVRISKSELTSKKILEKLEEDFLVKLLKNKTTQKGEPIFHLLQPKMRIVEHLCRFFDVKQNQIYQHWPLNVKKDKISYLKCINCGELSALIELMNKKLYNIHFNFESFRFPFYDDNFIENELKIKNTNTNRYRKLTFEQKEKF